MALLLAALALGVVGDVLAHVVPERLDAALALGALVLALVALDQSHAVRVPRSLTPLGLPLVLFGAALIWRDSPSLFGLNLLGVASVGLLASPWLRAVGRRRAHPVDYLRGAAELGLGTAVGGPVLALSEVSWREVPSVGPLRRAGGAAIGLVLAVPVAMVFGGLLMQADPVFDRLMAGWLDGDLSILAEHVGLVLLGSWLAAGLLRELARPTPDPARAAAPSVLGFTQVAVVLAVIDLLFLAFVAVQFRYLFGGSELVGELTGLTWAEYARRGFFELVTVAALALSLLLVADALVGPGRRGGTRGFRGLAWLMLILLDVMLASALYRMRLYTVQFGLTELRFYTTAFMGWLVLVFGWFGATVLRGRRERFAGGAVLAGWLVLAGLNLLNPDGTIVQVNLARARGGRPFDVAYAEGLSADALPALARGLPGLPGPDACTASFRLSEHWRRQFVSPGRWTISLARAPREPIGCGGSG
ncbi:MAG TPA: DUF4173 domain-containing protein [Gemmatimonadales bacterium]|nr:DUF4173 domain-containing protein [Gemmatimonadales bacterium]